MLVLLKGSTKHLTLAAMGIASHTPYYVAAAGMPQQLLPDSCE